MDRRRLQRLLVLDHRVLERVAVVLGERQLPRGVGAGEGDGVGLERGGEVDERLLDLEELEDRLVGDRLVQLVLERRGALVDVVDVAEEEDAGMPEEAEGEAVAVGRRADAADLVEKRRGDRGARAADGDYRPRAEDDAERDGAVGDRPAVVLGLGLDHRHVDDEDDRVVLPVEARPLAGVERVGEEVARHRAEGEHRLELGGGRLDEVYPARGRELRGLTESSIVPSVDRHHACAPFGRVLYHKSRHVVRGLQCAAQEKNAR